MEKRELICIGCPLGCPVTVTMEAGEVIKVEGNTCKRGDDYARKEVTNPTRIVTSTVMVEGGKDVTVSVKTKTDIPKEKIFDCVKSLKGVTVQAPVHIGDVILANTADTAVGLQNKGVDYFVEHIYPRIKDIRTNMIVNVSGSAIEDYVKTAEIINELDKIPAIELNISCPNVKQGGMAFGVSAKGASEVVKAVRSAYKKTLIVKLSPNVTDITEIARAAEESGADSVSLINTLLGMAIDAERKRPILSTVTGGMSGAAVKPIALRMVWQVAKAVNIPVIGLGGIMNWKDAVEFMLAGASAIQIGTANFIDPAVTVKVAEGINNYLDRHGCKSVKEIIGALEV